MRPPNKKSPQAWAGPQAAGFHHGLGNRKVGLVARVVRQQKPMSLRCWSVDTYNPCPGVIENVPSSNDYRGGFGTALMTKVCNHQKDKNTHSQFKQQNRLGMQGGEKNIDGMISGSWSGPRCCHKNKGSHTTWVCSSSGIYIVQEFTFLSTHPQ